MAAEPHRHLRPGDAPRWHYRTPIFGPPWQWPLELPIFQWLVAISTRLFGTTLEATGRAVSVAFFIGTLAASWVGLELFEIAPRHRPVVLALLWVSPMYIFWSRSFMMESTALFFAVAYVASVYRATRSPSGEPSTAALVAAAVAGALAGATKATTFVPFLAGATTVAVLRWRQGAWTRRTADVGRRRRVCDSAGGDGRLAGVCRRAENHESAGGRTGVVG